MIKLPIVLKTLDDTRLILQEGIAKRNWLEEQARLEEMHTDRYIRPINLIRAEENRSEDAFTYDKIKQLLLDMDIKEEEIAIQTGNLKEIDNVDLLSRACPIRYIITVDALKEGWDCPFAYVLSVVSSMESKTAIEQLIGRVLRMPYIEEKRKKELGYAYVYVASKNFESVADTIGETLVKNGFEAFEAKISITRSANSNESVSAIGGVWGEGLFEDRQVEVKPEEIDLDILNKASVERYVNYNSETGKVSIVAMPTASKREVFKTNIKKMLPEAQATELVKTVDALETSNPELLGKVEDFDLPYLAIEDEGYIVPFEESAMLEFIDVSDNDIIQNATLTEDEFDIDLIERSVLIDISDNSKIIKERIDVQESLFGTGEVNEETVEHKFGTHQGNAVAKKLATSIAKLIRDENEEILQIYGSTKLNEFIYIAITRLENDRKIPLQALFAKKYHLKRAMLIKLSKLVSDFKIVSFDKLLKVSRFSVSADHIITFSSDNYHPNIDSRSHEFKKHKYQYVDKLDSTEEYQVAKYIDELDGVATWIKNIPKNAMHSFWLQTAKNKFYPDFIIRLENGKTVVAEYKGEDRKSNDDTKRKEEIGNFWASRSDDLEFLMLYKDDYKEKLASVLGK
jgi:type III restriction enzyme